MNVAMLMRSHTPTPGVGKSASTRDAYVPVTAPHARTITIVAIE